jgi:GTPase
MEPIIDQNVVTNNEGVKENGGEEKPASEQKDKAVIEQEVFAKAIDHSDETLEQVRSVIEWSTRQGHGEMIFEVGGKTGLAEDVCDQSVANLLLVAEKMNCDATVVCERRAKGVKSTDVLIRERDAEKYSDIRIAVCGNVDAGKSTLVGVLTSGTCEAEEREREREREEG